MKKAAAWVLCAAWMAVIFLMSAMPGEVSGEQSGAIAQLILSALRLFGIGEAAVDPALLHLLVRKAAHLTEYAILFLLLHRALRLSGVRHPGLNALLLSAVYASTDEFHQVFTQDRGPSPIDVMIDTAGAALSWLCLSLSARVRARRKRPS